MAAIKTPAGWELVTSWPLNRTPMFRRMGIPGLMLIYRDLIDSYSLEIQGHQGAIAKGSLEDVVRIANERDTAHNLRVCGMDSDEWAQEFYGRSLIAFNALADGDSASIETSREQIGKMEAFLHDLRGRLRDKEERETYASRAERRSVEMKLATHEVYTMLLFGKPDAASAALDIIDDIVKQMRRECVATKRESKDKAS